MPEKWNSPPCSTQPSLGVDKRGSDLLVGTLKSMKIKQVDKVKMQNKAWRYNL